MLVINPGSHIGKSTPQGWTNTFEKAQAEAERWLKSMHEDDGLTDVELVRSARKSAGGRWTFTFRHKVTGVEVTLDTHGISDLDAYCKQYIFTPKVYWKGSSCSNPTLDDFAAPGFRKLATFVPSESRESGGILRDDTREPNNSCEGDSRGWLSRPSGRVSSTPMSPQDGRV